ncbi:MAG: hypothetical protein ACXWBN_16485 [Acidimicrobiales bacterium]
MTAVQTVNIIAGLPPVAAALVWIVAIGGAVLFVYRRVTGVGRPDPAPAEDEPTPTLSDLDAAPATPSAFFVEPTPDRPGIPLTGAAPDAPAPTSAPAPAEPAASGSSTRAGYFAPVGADAEAEAPAMGGARRLTVAEALRGITMPCGLSPVIDGTVSIPNPFRVAFLTTTADAATVGATLGDELERLGYQLTTATATEVLARKPGVELRVVLYPTPDKATRGLDPLFPVAPAGSVGVEFST